MDHERHEEHGVRDNSYPKPSSLGDVRGGTEFVDELLLPLGQQGAQNHADDAHDDGAEKRRPEAGDGEAGDQVGGEHEHERIDDQQE